MRLELTDALVDALEDPPDELLPLRAAILRDLLPRRAACSGVEVRGMNEYRVTVIGAGFESSAGWIYTADSPPGIGDEIEITSDALSSFGGISRERVRVEAIHADGTISGEEIT